MNRILSLFTLVPSVFALLATSCSQPSESYPDGESRYESFKDFTLFLASLLTVVSSAFIIYVNYK